MSLYTNREDWKRKAGEKYVTTRTLYWEKEKQGSGLWLIVPVDFVFEVSRPWYTQPLIDANDGRYLAAACLHDYALHIEGMDRGTAAGIFYDALRADGVGRYHAMCMAAVTMPGSDKHAARVAAANQHLMPEKEDAND